MNLAASHAILISREGNILLQHKDDYAKILNPGKISMFGGAIENSETEIECLRRELDEELELKLDDYKFYKFKEYLKTVKEDGIESKMSVYIIEDVEKEKLILHEGQAIIDDKIENLLDNPKLTRIAKMAIEDYLKAMNK